MHGLEMHLIRVFRYIQAAHLHLNLHDCELINNRFSLMAFGDLPYIVVLIGRTHAYIWLFSQQYQMCSFGLWLV